MIDWAYVENPFYGGHEIPVCWLRAPGACSGTGDARCGWVPIFRYGATVNKLKGKLN